MVSEINHGIVAAIRRLKQGLCLAVLCLDQQCLQLIDAGDRREPVQLDRV